MLLEDEEYHKQTVEGVTELQISEEVIEGTFLKECKNRFVCLVLINNEVIECYVPNSSRMEKYLKLKDKQVLLTVNKKINGRTKYSLFAVKHYSSYILLNLNNVNNLLEIAISSNGLYPTNKFQIHREREFEGYKSDLLLESDEEKIIIEAKGIISTKRTVFFPNVYSERFIRQLTKLKEFLQRGMKVHYFLISLSPFVKQINVDTSKGDYYSLFKDCIGLGMKVQAFSVNYKTNAIVFNDINLK